MRRPAGGTDEESGGVTMATTGSERADRWNAEHPVGTLVRFHSGVVTRETTGLAYRSEGGDDLVSIAGTSPVPLDSVEVVEEESSSPSALGRRLAWFLQRAQAVDLDFVSACQRALEEALGESHLTIGVPLEVLDATESSTESRLVLQLPPDGREVAYVPLGAEADRHRRELLDAGYEVEFRSVWYGPWLPDSHDPREDLDAPER